MLLAYSKLIAAISMTGITFFFSILPLFIILWVGRQENDINVRSYRVLSFLSCFGGGVFIATCLLHLFPEVSEQVTSIYKTLDYDSEFPMAEFLLCVGFLIVLLLEQIILSCNESESSDMDSPLNTQQHTTENAYNQNYETLNNSHENVETHHNEVAFMHPKIAISCNESSCETNSLLDAQQAQGTFNQTYGTINNSQENPEGHHSEVTVLNSREQFTLRNLLLVFALSLHSVFEGLAIGLQSSTENVFKLLFAVLIHKCVIAFTLGLKLTNSNRHQSATLKELIFFALTSPLGIIIGLFVVDFVTGLPMMIVSTLLQGLAAGTFLYVTFFEILPHELESNGDRMVKMMCLLLGFAIVSLLQLYLPS